MAIAQEFFSSVHFIWAQESQYHFILHGIIPDAVVSRIYLCISHWDTGVCMKIWSLKQVLLLPLQPIKGYLKRGEKAKTAPIQCSSTWNMEFYLIHILHNKIDCYSNSLPLCPLDWDCSRSGFFYKEICWGWKNETQLWVQELHLLVSTVSNLSVHEALLSEQCLAKPSPRALDTFCPTASS